jgi:hypothetical protein
MTEEQVRAVDRLVAGGMSRSEAWARVDPGLKRQQVVSSTAPSSRRSADIPASRRAAGDELSRRAIAQLRAGTYPDIKQAILGELRADPKLAEIYGR